MRRDPAAGSRSAACALRLIGVEIDRYGAQLVTLTCTHDVETWSTSAVRQEVALDQVVGAVETFLAPLRSEGSGVSTCE
ncbi:hypothetical protein [Kineococcus indalonis]|uniref:hypothetical protein n=1 Tax=Kineococcus indalonis TaxID=2696566 RepID=UPI001412DCE0|nr:hypothetical protein [Kineococcus indalonis]NAZ84787.1 hypothetical protein [Kineococcus indalonis]